MKKYHVIITSGAYTTHKEYTIECEDFNELKTELLKRFGNLEGTNKARAEKPNVKGIIKNATSISMIEKRVMLTHWNIEIREM